MRSSPEPPLDPLWWGHRAFAFLDPPCTQPRARALPPLGAQADAEGSKKRGRDEAGTKNTVEAAMKWAETFDALEEDDQYTYLEELAPRMTCASQHTLARQALPAPRASAIGPCPRVSPARACVRSRMHLQFLQGVLNFDDDEEDEDEFGEVRPPCRPSP